MKISVSARYNPKTDNPIYWFLNTETQLIETLVIPEEDSDSLFKVKGLTEQEINVALIENKGIKELEGIDWIEQYDVLTKKMIPVAVVRMKSAKGVRDHRLEIANEANIKREYRHSFDRGWYFGMPYNDDFIEIKTPIDPKYYDMLKDYPDDLVGQVLQWALTPIPHIVRTAFDIETLSDGHVVPDPTDALYPMISTAFDYSDDRPGIVYVVKASVRAFKSKMKRNQMLMEFIKQGKLKVELVNSEKELVLKCFERLTEEGVPLIVTFYGTAFDLPYLFNRAKMLNIPQDKIPINAYMNVWRDDKGIAHREWKAFIDNKLHIDMHKWHNLTFVKNYVHKNEYLECSLEMVSQALLGKGKFKHPGIAISELPLSDLVWYNYWDSYLTMELTKFNHEINMKILFLMMRLGRQKMGDAAHRAISSKIVNLIQGHMIETNVLIPTRAELQVFGTIESEAKADGKAFRGAELIDPIPGWHGRTVLVDFASLYPTELEKHNISFETMNCGHPECRDATNNRIPGLSHYTCNKTRGILPTLVGLIREIRVKIFKPQAKKDEEMKSISEALKVFINAAFGVTSFSSFDFYCPPAGESITACGRDSLNRLAEKAREYDVTVIMGDTDSVALEGATDEIIEELIAWSARELGIELAVEFVADVFIVRGKKNYIVITTDGKWIIKGLSGKKRNTPMIIRRCFNDVLDAWKEMHNNGCLTKENATDALIEVVRDYFLQIWFKQCPIEDYAFVTQMTKQIREYKKTMPIHVTAAKKLAAWLKSTSGTAYKRVSDSRLVPAGSYIRYVKKAKTRGKKTGTVTKPNIKPEPIPVQMATQDDICPELYHAILISVMSQLMDPLGIDEEKVVVPNPFVTQTTLEALV